MKNLERDRLAYQIVKCQLQGESEIMQELSVTKEPWERFLIAGGKRRLFEKFKSFLLANHCFNDFWLSMKDQDDDFFNETKRFNWITLSPFRDSYPDSYVWLNTKWRRLCK
jgi:hypothetical protein